MKAHFGAAMLVALASSAVAAPPAAVAPLAADKATHVHRVFDILREGSSIGTNTVDLSRQGDSTTVKVVTHILVKIMFVNAYRYEHKESATFRGAQLVAFTSTTDENGTPHEIDARENGGKLLLKIDGEESEVPKSLYPAVIYSPDISGKPQLFDPGNGKRLTAKTEDLGKETIPVHGTPQEVRHIKLSGTFERELWFDKDGLVRMLMFGSDHSKIVSELRASTAQR